MSRPILCLCTYSRCFELLKLVSSFIAKNFIFTRLLKIHVDLLHTCSLNPKTRKPYKGLKSGVYKSEGVQKQKQEKKKKSKRTILIKERGSKISKTGLVHNGLGTPETTFSIVTTAEPTFTRSLSPSIPTQWQDIPFSILRISLFYIPLSQTLTSFLVTFTGTIFLELIRLLYNTCLVALSQSSHKGFGRTIVPSGPPLMNNCYV